MPSPLPLLHHTAPIDPPRSRLLSAINRTDFLPPHLQPWGHQPMTWQTQKNPFVWGTEEAGQILQHLAIQPNDLILELGTHEGYLTALMGHISPHILTVDPDERQQRARDRHEAYALFRIQYLCQPCPLYRWPMDLMCVLNGHCRQLPAWIQPHCTPTRILGFGHPSALQVTLATRTSANQWRTTPYF